MNKQKRLLKKLIRQGIISAAIIAGFGGLYAFTYSMLESSISEKSAADKALSQDQSKVTQLSNQLEKSNIAEKRFMETQSDRSNFDYSANTNTLKDWLKDAIIKYRLSPNFKLSLTADQKVDNKDLTSTNYEAIEHPDMRFEFNAISDAHVFSFIDELQHAVPGFVIIDNLTLKRLGDVDKNTITLVRSGATPYMIEARISFNWVGLDEKPVNEKAKEPVAPAKKGGK